MAYFTCTLSAPTPSPTVENIITSSSEASMVLTTVRNPSTLEETPTKESSTESSTTAMVHDNEMVKIKLPLTTSSTSPSTVSVESLIGSVIERPEATDKNNEMIKIHESEASQVPSTTITSHLTSTMKIERKSINSMSTPMASQNVETKEMEMPINADNLKIMEEDVRAVHNSVVAKKGKEKENKKKALKTQQGDKKQKLKQKLFMDSTVPLQTALGGDEMHDTTTAISTSIKTAPTTIKSTTLTMTTTTTRESSQEETTNAPNSSNDNVIVLNSSSSGLIVVDVMENFGKENSTAVTSSSFEIKMDLIDDVVSPSTKDDIFTTTIEAPSSSGGLIVDTTKKSSSLTTQNDDIILINEATAAAATTSSSSSSSHSTIKWNELGQTDDIKITFDNIDLPHQNVNVSIENGELIIDSIDISVLNRVEEELRKEANGTHKTMGNNSLEIVLVEDDNSRPNAILNEETTIASKASSNEDSTTTIHFEMSQQKREQEMGDGSSGDDIKIKTTDKDSDTIFYISNTEVKVIESIPTLSPSDASDMTQVRRPAIYEEDVIVDVPKEKSGETPLSPMISRDKYEEDIVLSPLTSDFDPKDINYIGEAFLDVEESANGVGISESHHIIPLTSDVVIQPMELKDLPNVPIIGEPPQIELEEMMFGEDYDSKQQHASFQMEEFSAFPLNNRLVKNELLADVPREAILDTSNTTILSAIAVAPNKTHISVNTIINGTNMTTMASPFENITVVINPEAEEMADNSGGNPRANLL